MDILQYMKQKKMDKCPNCKHKFNDWFVWSNGLRHCFICWWKSNFEYLKVSVNLTKEIQEVKLEKEKIGKDIEIKKEPKSLQDFLGMFREKSNCYKNIAKSFNKKDVWYS